MLRRWRTRGSNVPETVSEPAAADVAHLPEWFYRLHPEDPLAEAAFSTIAALLPAVPTADLIALDQDVRARSPWRTGSWRGLDAPAVRRLAERFRSPVVVGAVAATNRNGHTREAAVRLLAVTPEPAALRWLVMRCTDWVDEVRSVAMAAVLHRLEPRDHLPAAVDALGMPGSLKFDVAARAGAIRAAVLERLQRPDARDALRDGLAHHDRRVRRQVFGLLAAVEPASDLLELALGEADIVSATLVADRLLAVDQRRGDAIRLLARSRLPPLRERAIWEAHLEPPMPEVVITPRSG